METYRCDFLIIIINFECRMKRDRIVKMKYMKRIVSFMIFIAVAVMLLPQCQQVSREKKAKYVFYFIGDGM